MGARTNGNTQDSRIADVAHHSHTYASALLLGHKSCAGRFYTVVTNGYTKA